MPRANYLSHTNHPWHQNYHNYHKGHLSRCEMLQSLRMTINCSEKSNQCGKELPFWLTLMCCSGEVGENTLLNAFQCVFTRTSARRESKTGKMQIWNNKSSFFPVKCCRLVAQILSAVKCKLEVVNTHCTYFAPILFTFCTLCAYFSPILQTFCAGTAFTGSSNRSLIYHCVI